VGTGGQATPAQLGQTDDDLKLKPESWWRDERRALQTKLDADVPPALAALKLWRDQLAAFNTAGTVRAAEATVEVAVNQAKADYDRLNATVLADKAEIDAFEELARRAAVPPGWLRPR
jgi:hypothetical protein